jgi:Secretion system C-terminal sorting domain
MKSKIILLLFLALLMSAMKILANTQAGSEITKIYVNNNWQPIAKTTTEFISSDDENCLVSSTKSYEFSRDLQVYKLKSRSLFNYNSSMQLESKLTQIFDETHRNWVNSQLENYTYSRTGQLQTTVIKIAKSGRWINRSKTTLTYLPDGMISKILVENYSPRSQNFEPVAMDVLLYNSDGRLITQSQQVLGAISNQWEFMSKTTFEYIHDQLAQKSNFIYDLGDKKFIFTDLEYYVYDGESRLTKILSQALAPNTMQLITTGIKDIDYYLNQNDILQITQLKRNESNGAMVNVSRISYTEYCVAPIMDEKSIESSSDEVSSITIYPNPGQNLNVNLNTTTDNKFDVRIFDAIGKVVLVQSINLVAGNNTIQLEAENLPNGNYVVQLESNSYRKHMNWFKQ